MEGKEKIELGKNEYKKLISAQFSRETGPSDQMPEEKLDYSEDEDL